MNQFVVWIIIGVAILGGGYFFLSGQGGDDAMMQKDDAMVGEAMEKDDSMMQDDTMMKEDATMKDEGTMEKDAMMEKDESAMMQKGSYETYAASKLALADSGDVVLFFRASWCPTCKALDANIRANLSAIPAGLTILDVDYDNSTALKQKYGVTYQHTFVQVRSDGSLVKKWSGSPTLAALVAEVQ